MSKFTQLQASAALQLIAEDDLASKFSAGARQFSVVAALVVAASISTPASAQNSPLTPSACASFGSGIGAILGAGIFGLTGVAAATKAGPAVVLSFVVSGTACAFAALAYAELAASLGHRATQVLLGIVERVLRKCGIGSRQVPSEFREVTLDCPIQRSPPISNPRSRVCAPTCPSTAREPPDRGP
jgi:hypothetical protein